MVAAALAQPAGKNSATEAVLEAVRPAAAPSSTAHAQSSISTQSRTMSTSAMPVRQPSVSQHSDAACSDLALMSKADLGAGHGQLTVPGQDVQSSAQGSSGPAAVKDLGLARGGIMGRSNDTMHEEIGRDNAARLADMGAVEVRQTGRLLSTLPA